MQNLLVSWLIALVYLSIYGSLFANVAFKNQNLVGLLFSVIGLLLTNFTMSSLCNHFTSLVRIVLLVLQVVQEYLILSS